MGRKMSSAKGRKAGDVEEAADKDKLDLAAKEGDFDGNPAEDAKPQEGTDDLDKMFAAPKVESDGDDNMQGEAPDAPVSGVCDAEMQDEVIEDGDVFIPQENPPQTSTANENATSTVDAQIPHPSAAPNTNGGGNEIDDDDI